MAHDLSIPEELLLLALDDESGGGGGDIALVGGILAELVFGQAIVTVKEGRRTFIDALPAPSSMTDPLLLECRHDIATSKKRRQAAAWVQKLGSKKDLKGRVAEPLVASGVLDERKRKILFIELTKYPEANPIPEAEMTERLRSAIEHDHITPDDRTVALVAIANATGLLSKNFDKKMLRSRKDRLKNLTEGDHVSEAVRAAIAAVNAAMVATMAAGAAASS